MSVGLLGAGTESKISNKVGPSYQGIFLEGSIKLSPKNPEIGTTSIYLNPIFFYKKNTTSSLTSLNLSSLYLTDS